MKLKQAFLLSAFSACCRLSSVIVHAKEVSTTAQDWRTIKDRHVRSTAVVSSLQKTVHEHSIPSEETVASTLVAPSSSSSLLRRELRKDVAENFKQCFDTCTENNVVVPTPDDGCCAGGVSFLKMEFHADKHVSGTITLGSSESCGTNDIHKNSKTGGSPKVPVGITHKHSKADRVLKVPSSSSSSSNAVLRFVDCNDICITKPFGGFPCNLDSVTQEKDVVPGSEICIAMVRPTEKEYEYEVAFDQKMEHNLHVLFLSNEGFSVGLIHTSCSKPLSLSWGVLFEDCDQSGSDSGKNKFEHVDVSSIGSDTPFLSFVDGISTEYFITADDALIIPSASAYVKSFDIGFNNCGCTCSKRSVTSPPVAEQSSVPAPSKHPTPSPTSTPTFDPSPAPTEFVTSTTTFTSTSSETSIGDRGPGFPPVSTCNSACSEFILQHCVFIGTNDACDINANVPVVADDDLTEGGAFGTFPPNALEPAFEDYYFYGKSKGSKGKGSKGYYGKGGYSKTGKKGSDSTGHYYGKFVKVNKGKGGKGRRLLSDSDYENHLQNIEYHRSRIDYYERLLMKLEA